MLKLYRLILSLTVLLSATAIPLSTATAAPDRSLCPTLFQRDSATALTDVDLEISADPFEQWLLWEEKSNSLEYRKPSTPVAFDFISLSKSEVEVWRADSSDLAAEATFLKDNKVLWLRHRYNTSDQIPFGKNKETNGKLDVRLTASRSVVIPELKISIKLPTDRPHPNSITNEPEKLRTAEDINSLRVRQDMIDAVDEQIGLDPELILLREPLAFVDPTTGNGIVFRDLSPLADGHYYLPALSIPYVGNEIAKLNGETFFEFWQRHYIEAVAKAKAKLLIRYGLQMETPNPQNFLIQLDKNLKPTGRIVVRDFADSDFYGPVARAKGLNKEIQQAEGFGDKTTEKLKPYFENSIYLFEESDDVIFSYRQQDKWSNSHDLAYAKEIERLLGTQFLKKSILPNAVAAVRDAWVPSLRTPVTEAEDFLTSTTGKELLRAFNPQKN